MQVAEYVRGRALPYLRAWRMHKLMSQVELARAAGVSIATVVRAEHGDTIVSFPNMRKLTEALGVSANDLMTRDPEAEGGK